MTVSPVDYSRFYDHASLTELVHRWADEAPKLVALESIGSSYEGRDLWLLTLTDSETGPAAEKPALFVEANIHSNELTSSFAALHAIHHLLSRFDDDARVQELLRTRAVYVVPRVNPDGAERVLAEHRYIRSSVRPIRERRPGLHPMDVDGDGRCLFMRIPDPHGPWKVCDEDPRLLVRREPDEFGGTYYRVLQEGEIVDYDGVSVPVPDPVEGLDLGANQPSDFVGYPAAMDLAGPFPGSEPEIQAMLRALTERPNVVTYVTCHTFGGLHISAPANASDPMPVPDRLATQAMSAKGSSLTGYLPVAYHEMSPWPYQLPAGYGQVGWLYGHLGLYAWVTEFWSPMAQAGLTQVSSSYWLAEHPVDDMLALLKWNDDQLEGKGYVDWYPFDHPQLGRVELGGWDKLNYWYNPPLHLVEQEVAPHSEWLVYLGLCTPRLVVRALDVHPVEPGLARVRAVVQNTGWLPTHGSELARSRGVAGTLTATIELPAGASLVTGAAQVDVGHLDGRTEARTLTTWWGHKPGTPDLALVEWLVRGGTGEVTVTAHAPRAGTARATARLA